MTKYETLFLCKPDLPEDSIQGIVSRLSDQVANNQGKLAVVDMWGHRRLGYPLSYRGSKFTKGFYILLTYLGSGRTVTEVERTIGLLEDVMRFQTVKLEDHVDPASITEVTHTRQKDEIIVPEETFAEEDSDREEAPPPRERPAPPEAESQSAGEAGGPAEPASPEPGDQDQEDEA
jgi:small subunit ribosomal protein S6